MSDLVECHSGFAYAERPVAFWWEGQRLEVKNVMEAQRIPEGRRFRVTTESGQQFELLYNESQDEWQIRQP